MFTWYYKYIAYDDEFLQGTEESSYTGTYADPFTGEVKNYTHEHRKSFEGIRVDCFADTKKNDLKKYVNKIIQNMLGLNKHEFEKCLAEIVEGYNFVQADKLELTKVILLYLALTGIKKNISKTPEEYLHLVYGLQEKSFALTGAELFFTRKEGKITGVCSDVSKLLITLLLAMGFDKNKLFLAEIQKMPNRSNAGVLSGDETHYGAGIIIAGKKILLDVVAGRDNLNLTKGFIIDPETKGYDVVYKTLDEAKIEHASHYSLAKISEEKEKKGIINIYSDPKVREGFHLRDYFYNFYVNKHHPNNYFSTYRMTKVLQKEQELFFENLRNKNIPVEKFDAEIIEYTLSSIKNHPEALENYYTIWRLYRNKGDYTQAKQKIMFALQQFSNEIQLSVLNRLIMSITADDQKITIDQINEQDILSMIDLIKEILEKNKSLQDLPDLFHKLAVLFDYLMALIKTGQEQEAQYLKYKKNKGMYLAQAKEKIIKNFMKENISIDDLLEILYVNQSRIEKIDLKLILKYG
ncbi:MAG: hypothetical protein KKA19_01595 [Candidatus Margulisbacteria bacterium]|nr:hypothetical protein [Candidatus Margulisiibacteriota bacterium]